MECRECREHINCPVSEALLGDYMRRAEWLQEIRLMRLGAYTGSTETRLSQEEASMYLRTF